MANLQKYTRVAVGHLFAHYERQCDEKGNYIKFGNQDIDTSKTSQNFNLAEADQPLPQINFLRRRMKEVECDKRKSTNVMCSWVVTVPKDLDVIYHENFFKESYDFLKNRYGKENVISAYVHLDETTPHLHFSFCPVWKNPDTGAEKFCAKNIFTRMELKKFHTDLQTHLEDKLQTNVNILTGVTGGKNKTITELKQESEQSQQDKISRKEDLKKSLGKKSITGKIVISSEQQDDLAEMILRNDELENALEHLAELESQNINERTKLGNERTELQELYSSVLKHAEDVKALEVDFRRKSDNIDQIIDSEVENRLKTILERSERYQKFMDVKDRYQKFVMPKEKRNDSRDIKSNTNSQSRE